MSGIEVRIVDMEPLRVVSAHGYGTNPEEQAWSKILTFAESQGLDLEPARFFGFNNPNPSPGSPNYGYEQWMTVGDEIDGEGDVIVKEIPARRYAVTRCEGLNVIGETWRQLVLWFEDSPHRKSPHWDQCLEELLTSPHVPYEEYTFDLYLPILD
jgi:effector-binding domain-containing protein